MYMERGKERRMNKDALSNNTFLIKEQGYPMFG